MRCATLAEAWRAHGLGPACVWGDVAIDFVAERLDNLGIDIYGGGTFNFDNDSVLLVDTYDIGIRRFHAKQDAALSVLADDVSAEVPDGYHVVWNPNAYDTRGLYPTFRGDLVTGPEALPIRSGLPRWEASAAVLADVAVSLGHSSLSDFVYDAITEVAKARSDLAFHVAGNVRTHRMVAVDSHDMWAELVLCGCLIAAAGTTIWEAAAVGIPVVVVQTAENQQLVTRWARAQRVPTLDARAPNLAAALEAALKNVRALPPLKSGAARVAATLANCASRRVRV